jgi:protein NRD1
VVEPPKPAAPVQDTSAILANLQALANMTKANPQGGIGAIPAQTGSSNTVSLAQSAPFLPSVLNAVATMPPAIPPVNAPTPANNGVMYGGFPPNMFNPAGQLPQPVVPPQNSAPSIPDALQQQIQILQTLKQSGVAESQWPAILSVLMANANPSAVAANQVQPTNVGPGSGDISRDRSGYDTHNRSPTGGRYRGRSRSRSPRGWDRRRENSPPGRRRDSPVYGEYGGNRERGGDDRDRDYNRHGSRSDRDNGRGAFRRRSPERFRRSPSPRSQDSPLPPPGPKWIDFDPELPKGTIKGNKHVS